MNQKIRDLSMPIGIMLGLIFHGFFANYFFLTPWFVFIMLYITMGNIKINDIKISSLHILILSFQIVAGIAVYFIIRQFNEIIAEGAMVIVIAPMATTSPVVASMLGANLSTMVSGTLLSNITVAIIAPIYFSWIKPQPDLSFFQSIYDVLSKITPLVVLPLAFALLTNRYLPKMMNKVLKHRNIPFYIWVISLTIVIGSTFESIWKMDSTKLGIVIWMFSISIVLCVLQFIYGRWAGKKTGDIIAGGQSVGQKNTVLAIWMAQTYMNPISSVIPASYVLWQNLFNSYQIWQKRNNKQSYLAKKENNYLSR